MSLKGPGVIDRWRERHRSHSGIPPALRPATAHPSLKEGPRDLETIIKDAVLAAFESEIFKTAVVSQIDPILSRQNEKLNQMKSSNLNLESNIQTQFGEIPSKLQPILDHLTNLKIPHYGKELESLLDGQKDLKESLGGLDSQLRSLEYEVQTCDGRLKSLQGEVESADLRSAIRFGEVSNELQDCNSTIGSRIREVQRDLGKRIDGQHRKVVSTYEDLRESVLTTEEKITSLETMQAQSDKAASTNPRFEEFDKKLEAINKGISKIDAAETGIKQEISAIQEAVSSLDTTPLSYMPRRLDAMDRTLSDLKRELDTQRTLASLDSKLLSGHATRLDMIAGNVAKVGKLMEDVHEEVCDDSEFDFTTEKLSSIESKIVSLDDTLAIVRKSVATLDNGALTKLEGLASSTTRIEECLTTLDTKHLASHGSSLDVLSSNVSILQSTLDYGFLTESQGLQEIHTQVMMLPLPSQIDTITSSIENFQSDMETRLKSLDNNLETISQVSMSTNEEISSHSKTSSSSLEKLVSFQQTAASAMEPMVPGLDRISSEIRDGDAAVTALQQQITKLMSETQTHHNTYMEFKTDIGAGHRILETLKSLTEDLTSKSSSHETVLTDIQGQVGLSHDRLAILEKQGSSLLTSSQGHFSLLKEVKELDKSSDILSALEVGHQSHVQHDKRLDALGTSLEEMKKIAREIHDGTSTEIRNNSSDILSSLEKSNTSHLAHQAAFIEAKTSSYQRHKSLETLLSALDTAVSQSNLELSDIRGVIDSMIPQLEAVNQSQSSHGASISRVLDLSKAHTTSLSDIASTSAEIASELESSYKVAASHTSTLGNIQDAILRDQELTEKVKAAVLQGSQAHEEKLKLLCSHESIVELFDKFTVSHRLLQDHSTSLSDVKSELIEGEARLRGNIGNSTQDVMSRISSINTALEDCQHLIENLGEKNNSSLAEFRSMIEESQICQSTKDILDEVQSHKPLLAKVATEAQGSQILEQAHSIKDVMADLQKSSKGAEILDELFSLRKTVRANQEACQDEQILAQIKENINLSESNRANLLACLETLQSVKKDTSSSQLPGQLTRLTSLVVELQSASQDVQILELIQEAKDVIERSGRVIDEIHIEVDHVKGDTAGTQEALLDIKDNIGAVIEDTKRLPDIRQGLQDVKEDTKLVSGIQATVEQSASDKSSTEALVEIRGLTQAIAENASSLTGIQDGVANATKSVKTFEESCQSQLGNLRTTFTKELAENRTTITTSIDDAAQSFNVDLQGLESKLASSTAQLQTVIEKELAENRSVVTASIDDAGRKIDVNMKGLETRLTDSTNTAQTAIARKLDETHSSVKASINGVSDRLNLDIQGMETRFVASTNQVKTDLRSADLDPIRYILSDLKGDVQSIQGLSADTAESVAAIPPSITSTNDLITSESAKSNVSIASLSKVIKSHRDWTQQHGKSITETHEQNVATLASIHETVLGTNHGMHTVLTETLPAISHDIQNIDQISEIQSLATQTSEDVSSLVTKSQETTREYRDIADKNSATATTIGAIAKFVQDLIQRADTHATVLSSTKEEITKATGQILTQSSNTHSELMGALLGVEAAMNASILRTTTTVNDNAIILARMDEEVNQILSKTGTIVADETQLLAHAINAIRERLQTQHSLVTETAETNAVAFSNIRSEISTLSSVTESRLIGLSTELTCNHLPNIISALATTQSTLESSNLHSFEEISTDLKSITSAIGATSTAVRVNLASISRIDKTVLETGEKVRGVIHEGNAQLIADLESAVSQLDESLHDNGTRIRGIAEYGLPRLESDIKGMDERLEHLVEHNSKTGERNKDALTVIGCKVVGTAKRFEEMVDAAGRGEMDHGGGSWLGGSLRGSRILGSPKRDLSVSQLAAGAGRLRGESNASTGSREGSVLRERLGQF